MPFALALLAEYFIRGFKITILFSSGGGPKALQAQGGCVCALAGPLACHGKWVELPARRSVDFDSKCDLATTPFLAVTSLT